MKKLIIVVALLSLVLSACNGQTKPSGESKPPAEREELKATTDSSTTEKEELRVTTDSVITEQEAKEIALAKVPGATTDDIREFETDLDNGRKEYEGKIIYDDIEYEFEIDAKTGNITNWETESVYD